MARMWGWPASGGPLVNLAADFLGWQKTPRNPISSEAAAVLDKKFPPDWPEIEYFSALGYVEDFNYLFTTRPRDGYQCATVLGALVAHLSRDTVTLASADTKDLPVIDPNWLTDPTDVAVAIATFKRLRQALASNALHHPIIADNKEYFPGTKASEYGLCLCRKDGTRDLGQ
ncbi:FAD-linked reductase [Colletotrichum caudatum]|nr:FAD-linked reductase [Colletotrichum caudatum]